ncbi:glycosyltransferase [Chryseobacterium sp.]|uniref:glycosyltransferase n=1 Tax=Chryseobacterium sp. TaxID=1871047 RepID=UPI00289F2ACC|nr:glycosyltransferase [Chryseobacterium sp.]
MKVLIITSHVPYPLDEGGKISQYVFAEKLQDLVSLSYIIPVYNERQLQFANDFKAKLSNIDVKIIKCFLPAQKEAKKLKQKKNYKKRIISTIYNFYYSFKAKENPKKNILKSIEYNDFDRHINIFNEINSTTINELINHVEFLHPDLIQVEHTGLLNIIEALPMKIPKIFVHHEIIFARLESQKLAESHYTRYKIKFVKDYELFLLNKYNAVITFSEEDKKKLVNNNIQNKIYAVPFPVLDDSFRFIPEKDFKIEKIIFIGPEYHEPNYDAVVWFHSIAEEIFKITGLKTYIIGSWSHKTISMYSSDFFVFEGYVKDITIYTNNSISIAPIRIGSGIRTKILYSLAQFAPVVSTQLGCEGIGLTDCSNILIADDIESFKTKIFDLFNSPSEAYKLSKEAFNFIQENFSQEKLTQERLSIYKELLS